VPDRDKQGGIGFIAAEGPKRGRPPATASRPAVTTFRKPRKEGQPRGRRQQSVSVVGHDDEFVQKIFSLFAIIEHHVQQQTCSRLVATDRKPPLCDGGDEESALWVHPMDRMRREQGSRVMSSHIASFIMGMVTPEEGRGKRDGHAQPWKSGAFSAAFGL